MLRDLPKSKIMTDKTHYDSLSKLFRPMDRCKVSSVSSLDTSQYSFDAPPPSLGLSTDSYTGGISTYTNRFLQNGRILAVNLYSNLKAGSLGMFFWNQTNNFYFILDAITGANIFSFFINIFKLDASFLKTCEFNGSYKN